MPPRKAQTEDAPEALEPQDIEAAEVADIEAAADNFDPDPYFASGDARDVMLQVIKQSIDWQKLNEHQQRDINAAVSNAALVIVQKVAKALASEDRESSHATVTQVTVKADGLKIAMTAPMDLAALETLARATGKQVLISIPDVERFDHSRAPAPYDPDQPPLIPDGPEGDGDLAGDPDFITRDERTGRMASLDIGVTGETAQEVGDRARRDAIADAALADLADAKA